MSSGTATPVNIDVRALVHAIANPTSNEQYQRDQQTLTDCFKEPGDWGYFWVVKYGAHDRVIPLSTRARWG